MNCGSKSILYLNENEKKKKKEVAIESSIHCVILSFSLSLCSLCNIFYRSLALVLSSFIPYRRLNDIESENGSKVFFSLQRLEITEKKIIFTTKNSHFAKDKTKLKDEDGKWKF